MARKDGKDRGIVEIDGIWWVDMRHEGKRIRRKVGSKSAALSVYQRLKTEAREGRLVPKVKKKAFPTVREIVEDRVSGFTGRARTNERKYADWWIGRMGDRTIETVSPGELRKLLSGLSESGEWSSQTVNHYFGHFRAALNQAIKDGRIEHSPMAKLELLRLPRGRLRFLTEAEESRLKEIMAPGPFRLVRFAILTGLRREEQFALRWENIDTENRVLTIPRSKNGDCRHVPLSDEVIGILKEIRREERVISPWCFPSLNPLTHVDPQNFYKRIYQPALDKAGIDGVIWHTLRHTCASRLVMAGVDIRTVQEIMGHKTLAMTMRYSHLSGGHLNQAINRISNGSIPEATDTKTDKPKNEARKEVI